MKLCLLLTPALLLAACSQQGGNNQQAAAGGGTSATATASSGFSMEPGEWETTVRTDMAAIANLPAGVELPQAQPITSRMCYTPEQVRDARTAFLSHGGQPGVECDYGGVTITGGRIHGTSTCRSNNIEMSSTMDGSFTPTSYNINQQIRSTIGGQTRESTLHMIGRRVGDCPPGGPGK